VFSCGEPDEASRKASIARLPAFTRSMRPPTAEEARLMQLQRCHRVLPQDNDTGGFFVAVLHLLPDHSPTPSEYQACAVEDGPSTGEGKKKKHGGQEVSAEASMEIMRNLGYNPKHTTIKGTAGASGGTGAVSKKTPVVTATGSAKSDIPAAPVPNPPKGDAAEGPVEYRLLGSAESRAVCEGLQLDPAWVAAADPSTTRPSYHLVSTLAVPTTALGESTEEGEEVQEDSYAGIFGSKATGWVRQAPAAASTGSGKKCGPTTRYCLVSENVRAALSTWASGTPVFLRQAGVAVADLIDGGTTGSIANGHYRVLPDAATVLATCVRKELVVNLAPADFKFVLKLALQYARSDEQDADISALLEQAAALTAADFYPDSASLEGLNAEAAELQVALAGGLSAEGLQRLGDAYREQVAVVAPGSVMHVYVACEAAVAMAAEGQAGSGEAATGAAAGGEKRRLSKAERKKLKAAPHATSSSATSTAAAAGKTKGAQEVQDSDRSAGGAVGGRGPEVLLLEVGDGAVKLSSAYDLCRSYLDAL
jgi:hypothetical protein